MSEGILPPCLVRAKVQLRLIPDQKTKVKMQKWIQIPVTPPPNTTNSNSNEAPDDWETAMDMNMDTNTKQQQVVVDATTIVVKENSEPVQKEKSLKPPRHHRNMKWSLTKKEVDEVVKVYLTNKNKKKNYLSNGQIKAAIASVSAVKNQNIKKGASLVLLGEHKKLTPQTLSYVELAAKSPKECFTRQLYYMEVPMNLEKLTPAGMDFAVFLFSRL